MKFVDNRDAIKAEMRRKQIAGIDKTTQAMVDPTKAIAPYDPKKPAGEPHFRDDIQSIPAAETATGVSGAFGAPNTSYGVFLELGTEKMDKEPSIIPTFDSVAPQLAQNIADA